MTSCNGLGECLIQCECECYNEKTDEFDEVCICGHREHAGYCPTNCCVPVECRNYKYCGTKQPQQVSYCHNGMCMNCAVQMGKHTYTNIIEECCVCFEDKIMLILKCNHKVCNDCWFNITNNNFGNNNHKPCCPLCRNLNEWTKPTNLSN